MLFVNWGINYMSRSYDEKSEVRMEMNKEEE